MKFKIETLRTHPLARFFARLSNRCTVVLTSGMELYFDRRSNSIIYDNLNPLSDDENKEYIQAMKLIDV